MSKELVIRSDQDGWEEAQLAALTQLGLTDVPAGDLSLFFHQCKRTGLDPFTRQVYMIGRYDTRAGCTKYTIQASIDGLRVVAQRSNEYAGQTPMYWCDEAGTWSDVWLKSTPPLAAKIGVYRKGFVEAVWAVAKYNSYVQLTKMNEPTSMWRKMPDLMIAKVAEALALRKAFPQDLSGIYSTEEMTQSDNPAQADSQVTEAAPVDWLIVMAQVDKVVTRDDLVAVWNENKLNLDAPIEVEGVILETTLRVILNEKSNEMKAEAEKVLANEAEAKRLESEATGVPA